ncbi:polyprenyl synthetase family protein [Soehngenia longivitae]|uniref:Farnesyl diphosphate synthase n=2 Tax=Soehngenia longivitae TaxID=2562294 RepID=A0A4Z0D2I5_9FIRM|nr:polyprenyl synthetase family protein [Soehngenia longivitae]
MTSIGRMIMLEELFKEYIPLLDNELESIIAPKKMYQERLYESMKYSLFSGGKRLRPMLFLMSYTLFSNNLKIALPFAASIEMIHTYSLIHDDLPSMDNDDYRRGKLTSHKMFGESLAILTGDALFNLAYETILKLTMEINDYRVRRAGYEISKAAGYSGMILGQVIDTCEDELNSSEIMYMYSLKTAELIRASISTGAILGGANNEQILILDEFGKYLGISYQIQDDILDLDKDKEINKLTLSKYHSKDQLINLINESNEKCLNLLSQLDNLNTSFFEELVNKLAYRNI